MGESNQNFVETYHREIVEPAHKLGASIVNHTDGTIWPLLMISWKWVLAGSISFNHNPWISRE